MQVIGIFPIAPVIPIFKPGGGGLGLGLGGLGNLFPGSGGDGNASPIVIGTPVQNPLDSNSATLLVGSTGILTTQLTVLGNIYCSNNILSSNVLATNMYSSNNYSYNSFANNSFANTATANNLIFANGIGQNLNLINLFAVKGSFQNIIANNALIQNLQNTNSQISYAQINDLTITNSIKITNQLNNQIINTIKQTSSSNSIVNTVSWEDLNLLYPDKDLVLTITQTVKNDLYSANKIQSFNIDTYSNIISPNASQGFNDVQGILSMSIITSSTDNTATFNCISSLSNISLHSTSLTVNLIPDNIGDIKLY